MRFTIETTSSKPGYAIKSIVEVDRDDIALDQVRVFLNQLLRGYGFYVSEEE